MKTKKITVISFAICSVIVLACASCAKSKTKALTVQSDVEMTETNINSQISGKVNSVAIKEGDSVTKGQLLISIDSDTLNAQLSQAKARIVAAEAQKESAIAADELAESSFKRVKPMFDQGVITKAEFDDASTKRRQAAANLEAMSGQLNVAKAALKEVMTYVEKTIITAPTSGIVTMINIESGELISTSMPLVVITDKNNPWIQCSVRETNLSKVAIGQTVRIRLPTYKDEEFMGRVVRVNKDADFAVKRATNDNGEFDIMSYGVKVELINCDKPLYSGMTAFIDFGV